MTKTERKRIETTIGLLEEAKGFIKKGWCQHTEAEDANGNSVGPTSMDAERWCAWGAILAARPYANSLGTFQTEMEYAVAEVLPKSFVDEVTQEAVWVEPGDYICDSDDIVTYNDTPKRTKAEVLRLYSRAIRTLKKKLEA